MFDIYDELLDETVEVDDDVLDDILIEALSDDDGSRLNRGERREVRRQVLDRKEKVLV